jgi:hypothetical protein
VAVLVITEFLIYSSRIAQANLSQMHAGEASRRFYEHVASSVHRSMHIDVLSGGLDAEVTLVDGTVCSYTYLDADSDPATIMDNRVIFDPDVDTGGDDFWLVSGITPGVDLPAGRALPGAQHPLSHRGPDHGSVTRLECGDRAGPPGGGRDLERLPPQSPSLGRVNR